MRQKNCWPFEKLCFLLLCLFLLPPTAAAQDTLPRFEPAACPVPGPDTPLIECGYLIVPEDYDQPEKRSIRLPVIIIHASASNPAPDAVLYTDGGPGYSSLGSVWWLARSSFVENRDVVIFEQRGNLFAEPNLACDISVWWEEEEGHTPCLDSLHAKGIDLTLYTTDHIVADLNALREVLGYEEWNLYGNSYSTQVMQLAMRHNPEQIRSVILQSTSSITATRYEHDPEHAARSIQVMLDDCAADPECAAAYPELESQLYALIEELNQEPVAFEVTLPGRSETSVELVDGRRLIDWIVQDAFYNPAFPPYKTAYFPLLIDQVTQGRTELLYPWLHESLVNNLFGSNFAWGLYLAVNCQADSATITPEMIARQTAAYPELGGYFRHAREVEICELWDLPPGLPSAGEPAVSDIPTLILAGSYDPVTPPEWGQAAADYLSTSFFVEFPSAGHNLDTTQTCAQSIKAAFLNDPQSRPDLSCRAELPDPTFITPDDIAVAPGVYHIIYDVDPGNPTLGKPLLEFLAVGSLIILSLTFVYQLAAELLWFFRRYENFTAPSRIARFWQGAAGLTAIVGWVVVLLLSDVMNRISHMSFTTLYFGLPLDDLAVLFLAVLAPIFVILSFGLVVLTAIGWWRRFQTTWERAILTLSTAAAVIFTGFLIYWDLHLLLL